MTFGVCTNMAKARGSTSRSIDRTNDWKRVRWCAYFCAKRAYSQKKKERKKMYCLVISLIPFTHKHICIPLLYAIMFSLGANAKVDWKTESKSKSKFYSFVICSFLHRFVCGVFFLCYFYSFRFIFPSLPCYSLHVASFGRSVSRLQLCRNQTQPNECVCGSCTFFFLNNV